ncbi:MAG: hypothetical protein HWE22_03290 [Flavobacteriales bacterium]|nr:hypothetical protein [Flavobacteriales bacterium]
MNKSSISPFRIIAFAVLLVFAGFNTSCEKYSSPRKVERHIVEGTWRLSSAFIDNDDVTNIYANYSFNFTPEGDIVVIGDATISGSWSTGIEKNPTTLNITLTPFVPFNDLNADWTVTTCTKERMTLELHGASAVDVLIITRN